MKMLLEERLNDEGDIADRLYKNICSLGGKISKKINNEIKDPVKTDKSTIFIVGKTTANVSYQKKFMNDELVKQSFKYDTDCGVKIKLATAPFTEYTVYLGTNKIALDVAINEAYTSAREELGKEIASNFEKEGTTLSIDEFDFEQSIGKNAVKSKYNILEEDIQNQISSCLVDLNRRIKDSYRKGIKSARSEFTNTLEHKIVVNNGGAIVSQFIPRSVLNTEVNLNTPRNINESKAVSLGATCGPEILLDMFDCKNGMNIDVFVEELKKRCVDYIQKSKYIEKLGWVPNKPMLTLFDPESAGMYLHETIGHHVERDLDDEKFAADFFGTILQNNDNKKITKDFVDISFDPGFSKKGYYLPFGYYFFDDEGVRGKKADIITKGELTGMLNNLLYSKIYKEEPNGHCRGDWIRMSHLVMSDKGAMKLDELIETVKRPILYIKKCTGGETEEVSRRCRLDIDELYFIDENKEIIPIANYDIENSTKKTQKAFTIYSSSQQALNNLVNIAKPASYGNLSVLHASTCGKNQEEADVSETAPFILLDNIELTANNIPLKKDPLLR